MSKNDFLGQIVFDLESLLKGPISGWHKLLDEKSIDDEKQRGQIRLTMAYESDKLRISQMLSEVKFIEARDQTLDVFVGTWNVGNAPPPEDLSAWLPKNKHSLYVVGAQECKYKHREGFASCEEDWLSSLKKHFGSKYVMLKAKSLGEMRIALFCKDTEAKKFGMFETATEATGIGHVIANKGGVAIACCYNDTSLCFVNAHLAAHQHKTLRRNSDVQEILNGIAKVLGSRQSDIMCQFDHVVFMGDLNYRLDFGDQGDNKSPSEEQFKTMVKMIHEGKLEELFAVDQLTKEMRENRVFCGFKEGFYNFAPTFKVLREKKLEYNKERSPSWCDRILWHSLTKEWIKQINLGAASEILTSDHKPVYTLLHIPIVNLPPLVDQMVKKIVITFDQFKCFRLPTMDNNGLADPYLHFSGSFFPYSPKCTSNVVWKNLNPVFDTLPEIDSTILNPERLKHCHLIIKVCDKDMVGSSTIGYTILPIRWFLPQKGKVERTKMFRHRIMKGGVYVGNAVIQGTVTVSVSRIS
mmetsp:Transcript_19624/g.29285  ORF Transcript_19624/g.29285 Transcript_19624/m.29285 type:complete len:524 (+) Transcript_19624:295-1866(+)